MLEVLKFVGMAYVLGWATFTAWLVLWEVAGWAAVLGLEFVAEKLRMQQ